MLKFCSFCQQNIEVQKFQQFGGHRAVCIKNPGRLAARLKQSRTLTKPRITLRKQCPKCQVTFEVISVLGSEHKSRRYCSYRCASSRTHSQASKNKTAKTMADKKCPGRDPNKTCLTCGNSFRSYSNTRKFCSRKCIRIKWRKPASIKQRQFLSSMSKRRWADPNRTIGWNIRTNKTPSYPEKFFIDFLTKHGVVFEREKHEGRYWIDFAIGNIALEIDGKQHKVPERQAKDREKDRYLSSLGYDIIRVEWGSVGSKVLSDLLSRLMPV